MKALLESPGDLALPWINDRALGREVAALRAEIVGGAEGRDLEIGAVNLRSVLLLLPTPVRDGVIGTAMRGEKAAEALGRGDDLRSASVLFSR